MAKGYHSENGGHWDRLGPWVIDVTNGTIELAAMGGHANLSGLEIWRGRLTEKHNPLRGVATVAMSRSRETDVAVVLARNCLECHNASDRKGGLDLTRREQALAGGDSGQVLKPGDLDSLLVQRIEAGEMPSKGRDKLSAADRQLLRDWVRDGAIWAADPIDPFLYTSDRRAGYNWWSLQPLRVVEPPPTNTLIRSVSEGGAGQPRSPIDNFILHRLEKAGLKPSPEADRRTLIRRLTFDLIGLPPTPDEVEDFVNDRDPRAYDELVDRLLDSPHYGERWARHWLDIVRFGESQGFERNKLRPSVWKYRDFVVEAFNSDLPYDDFIRWQIAGDVLRPDDPLAVAASGFLAIGPYDLTAYNNGTPDMRAFAREEELEGLVGSVGQTFLGLTINCRRCHDHKFDPITQREFYQISAALGGTYQGDERESLINAARPAVEKRIAALKAEIEKLRSRHAPRDEPNGQTTSQGNTTSHERSAHHAERDGYVQAQRSRLEAVVRLLQGGPVHTTVPKQPGAWPVLVRGDFKQPGEVVAPRGIASVTGASPDWNLSDNAPEANRRSLYRTGVRAGTSPLLDTLDCPDPSVPTPRRSVTSTPLQALSLLNDAFIEHYAARFAERLRREAGDDATAQVRRGYVLSFARQPTPEETAFGQRFIAEHGLFQLCIVLFNASEFLFVD